MESSTEDGAAVDDTAADTPPDEQAITLDGAPTALVEEAPPPAETVADYRYDDLEYDGDTAALPGGYEITLRGLCRAAAFRLGLTCAAEWNLLDMPKRQDAVAEEFVCLADMIQADAQRAGVVVEIVPPQPCVRSLDEARALPLQPEGTVAKQREHAPGTVVRFKEPDGTTMVVVIFNGALYKATADDQPQEA